MHHLSQYDSNIMDERYWNGETQFSHHWKNNKVLINPFSQKNANRFNKEYFWIKKNHTIYVINRWLKTESYKVNPLGI